MILWIKFSLKPDFRLVLAVSEAFRDSYRVQTGSEVIKLFSCSTDVHSGHGFYAVCAGLLYTLRRTYILIKIYVYL